MEHDHQLQEDSNNDGSVPVMVEHGGNMFVQVDWIHKLSINGINPPKGNTDKLKSRMEKVRSPEYNSTQTAYIYTCQGQREANSCEDETAGFLAVDLRLAAGHHVREESKEEIDELDPLKCVCARACVERSSNK